MPAALPGELWGAPPGEDGCRRERPVPSEQELWGLVPDPDTDPPAGIDAWAAVAPAAMVMACAQARQEAVRGVADPFRPDSGIGEQGAGFAAGGPADGLAAGEVLAGLAARAAQRLDRVNDDELIGIARAWRRLASWATAGELAAVAELDARRDAQVAAGADPHLAEHVGDELAAALTLTSRAADLLLEFGLALRRLPATWAALRDGAIDRGRAWVIADETACLKDGHAAAVEAAVIGRAGELTTGQLRAAARRAALAADPSAADRRRQEALKEARVEKWDERSGTAALAGRDLPPAEVLAADEHINRLARHLKSAGADGSLDVLRARVYTTLLLGQPVAALRARLTWGTAGHGPAGQAGASGGTRVPEQASGGTRVPEEASGGTRVPEEASSGTRVPEQASSGTRVPEEASSGTGVPEEARPGAVAGSGPSGAGGTGSPVPRAQVPGWLAPAGSVNLTMPLATWLGGSGAPGEAAGFGPIPATDAQALAALAGARPGSRWCITLTGQDGRPIGHGCARIRSGGSRQGGGSPGTVSGTSRPGDAGPAPGWELTVTIRALAYQACSHERESSSYRPPPGLCHLITVRQRRCSFPGCRRPATGCDQEHTVPFGSGGRTCECNLAPLCRRHHRAKQAQGWRLDQPEPGVMSWTLPHGRRYRTGPQPYPGDGPAP